MSDLRTEKQAMREEMKKRRALAQKENPKAGLALRDLFLRHIQLPERSVVAAYRPINSEIDVIPLTEALQAQGHVIVLPVVVEKAPILEFRRYQSGDRLMTSPFGVDEPLSSAPVLRPDIVLVPLLAFDRHLYRLGYGGGFYDRTIMQGREKASLTAIGLAYAAQFTDLVPHDESDARLDKIVTEIQIFER